MTYDIPRFMLAGTHSGCGKTTLTLAVLGALRLLGHVPCSFKCGPDYIDPMFHAAALETPSWNLDAFLCGEENMRQLFARHGSEGDIAVLEGVMGLYDGMGQTQQYSSNHVSQLTQTPQVLVVDAKGKGRSLLAEIFGYTRFAPNRIRGVIFNRATRGVYDTFGPAVEAELGLKPLGYLPELRDCALESRRLGLAIALETPNLRQKLQKLAKEAAETLDIPGLVQLANEHRAFACSEPPQPARIADVRIAVAKDDAFYFYYADALALLEQMGAQLAYFSPLHDASLPEGASGLLIGGGYPEEYARGLSENAAMRRAISGAVRGGLPALAEGGGFAYLTQSLTDASGQAYPMAGVIDTHSRVVDKMKRFGYITLTAKADTLLCEKGAPLHAHEFHYVDSDDSGQGCTAAKGAVRYDAVHTSETLWAGYPHLHLCGNPGVAAAFLRKCEAYRACTR